VWWEQEKEAWRVLEKKLESANAKAERRKGLQRGF